MKTYRIGVLGLTHDHVWGNVKELVALENAELAGVSDPNEPLRVKAAEEFGCAGWRTDAELLDEAAPDAVYVFGSNRDGTASAVEALGRGVHVLIEKPMAADLAGADAMLAAAKEGGARLMVNWPFAWEPQLQHALALAASGSIGRLWQVKYRAAHRGPKELGCSEYFCDWLYDARRNGAGALMDYCCYGAVLASVLLGKPASVTGVAGRLCKDDIDVEDNAILVMSYPRAMATAEASWSQVGYLTSYATAIYGDSGTLFVEPGDGGRVLTATVDEPMGVVLEVPEPAPETRSGSAHFLACLESGDAFMPLADANHGRDAQAILEAGIQSVASGCGEGL